jgi:chemotaxis protein MotA
MLGGGAQVRFLSFSTLLGIILGFGLFVYAIVSGTQNYIIFWSASSLLLVLGGTLAATMISYEGRYVWKALAELFKVIVPTQIKPKILYEEVEMIIAWGKIGAREGIPGLEKEFKKVDTKKDSFLHHCIQLMLAGYDTDNMKGKLETFMSKTYERNMVRATILNTMANIAPGFGMIGTLVGLIIMLSELDGGTGNLGEGLALALITTLYGVILAQLVFKPASRRAEQKQQIIRFKNQLTTDAFLLLMKRANSIEIQDHLNSFLDPAIHFDSAKK